MGIEKKATEAKYRAPPDVKGWRKIVGRSELDKYFIQDVVRAARTYADCDDRETLVALIGHISDQILKVLRAYVGTNHLNDGKNIIYDAHSTLIHAVLDPDSKDGEGLCEAFVKRVQFRALDEIKEERKTQTHCQNYEYVPDEIPVDQPVCG